MLRPALAAIVLLALSAPAAAALGLSLDLAPVTVDASADVTVETALVDDVLDAVPRAADVVPRAVSDALPAPRALAPLPLDLPGVAADAEPRASASGAVEAIADAEPETLAALGGGLVWLLLLYFRVQPDNLLENERRERVITMIRERPGIGPSEIGQTLGTGWGATMYHLDRLERAGLVVSRRAGHHRCYFVPGALPKDAQAQVGIFRGDTARRVAQLLLERPGLTQTQLCQALGLSASAASKQLSRLEAASLVRREATSQGTRVYPADTLGGALAPVAA